MATASPGPSARSSDESPRAAIKRVAAELYAAGRLPAKAAIGARLGVAYTTIDYHVKVIRSVGRPDAWPYPAHGSGLAISDDSARKRATVRDLAARQMAEDGRVVVRRIVRESGLPRMTVWHHVGALKRAGRWPYPTTRGRVGFAADDRRLVVEIAAAFGGRVRPWVEIARRFEAETGRSIHRETVRRIVLGLGCGRARRKVEGQG